MNTAAPNSSEKNIDSIRSLLIDYAQSQERKVVEQYCAKLDSILTDLRSAGFCTRELENHLIAALKDKKNGNYINRACELSAAGYFMTNFPTGFKYQVENMDSAPSRGDGSPKDFDFSFVADEYVFNVEVKTFALKPLNNETPPIKSFLPPSQTKAMYNQGMRVSQNCAPAIGRFLKDANTQLVRPDGGLSVVLLCCNDLDEYADALTCFVSPHGICHKTANGELVPSPTDLPNIDAVVICNLGFNHSAVVDLKRYRDFFRDENENIPDGAAPWNYALALPVGFCLRQESRAESLLKAFMTAFRSHSFSISNLMDKNGGDVQQAVFDLFNSAINTR